MFKPYCLKCQSCSALPFFSPSQGLHFISLVDHNFSVFPGIAFSISPVEEDINSPWHHISDLERATWQNSPISISTVSPLSDCAFLPHLLLQGRQHWWANPVCSPPSSLSWARSHILWSHCLQKFYCALVCFPVYLMFTCVMGYIFAFWLFIFCGFFVVCCLFVLP